MSFIMQLRGGWVLVDDARVFGAGVRSLWLAAVFCVFGFGLSSCADAWGDSISEARIVNASGSSFSLRYDDVSGSYADGAGPNQNAYVRVYAGSNSDLTGKYVCVAYVGGSSFRAVTMSFEGDCEAMGDVVGNGPFSADTDVVFLSNRAYYPGVVYAVVSVDNMVSLDDVFVRIDPVFGWLSGDDGGDVSYGSYDVGVCVVSGNVSVNVTRAYADDGGVIAVDYDYVVVSVVNSSGDVVDSGVTSLGDVVVLDSFGDDDVCVFVNGIEEWEYTAPLEPADDGAGSGGGSGGGVVVIFDAGADADADAEEEGDGCVEDWGCGNWSSCSVDGVRARACVDANGCGTVDFRPAVSVFCEYVSAEEKEDDVPTALFDINVEVIDALVAAGDELFVKVILVNFGSGGPVDAHLHYVVEDGSGDVVYDGREVVAVEAQKEFLKSFDVSALDAGEYNLFVDIEYAGQVAPAGYEGEFTVLAPEPVRFPFLAGVAVVICLFVLYVFRNVIVYGFRRVYDGVLGVFVRRRGERLRARFVLDSSDALRGSFGGDKVAGSEGSFGGFGGQRGSVPGVDATDSYLRSRNDCSVDDSYWSERETMRRDGDD